LFYVIFSHVPHNNIVIIPAITTETDTIKFIPDLPLPPLITGTLPGTIWNEQYLLGKPMV